MVVEAIKPGDIGGAKLAVIPDAVMECWNRLIASKFTEGVARVLQEEAVVAIMDATGAGRADVFSRGWLNVEEIYRAAGWNVKYDRPAYNESYPAEFCFSNRRD